MDGTILRLIAQIGLGITQLAIAYTVAHAELEKPPPLPTYEITAYTSGVESTGKRPGDAGYGITASGEMATEGRTIACASDLPFGTTVAIEGIGERVCQDRGGAINGKHIDLYMNDVGQALAFGVQERKVKIIRKGDD